jgi:isochorismate pyruvate lyase
MAQVRAGVDRIDAALVALLAERFTFMDAAARIKSSRDLVRDEVRKAQVIALASTRAHDSGLPDGLAPMLWELLVEASIDYEQLQYDALHGDPE